MAKEIDNLDRLDIAAKSMGLVRGVDLTFDYYEFKKYASEIPTIDLETNKFCLGIFIMMYQKCRRLRKKAAKQSYNANIEPAILAIADIMNAVPGKTFLDFVNRCLALLNAADFLPYGEQPNTSPGFERMRPHVG
jgi:hypothetical protein